jgi:hypothetical protein
MPTLTADAHTDAATLISSMDESSYVSGQSLADYAEYLRSISVAIGARAAEVEREAECEAAKATSSR